MNQPLDQQRCPYQMLEQTFANNRHLIESCEMLIARNEQWQQDYNQIVEYANTLGKQAQQWKKRAEEANDRNRQLIQGMEMACQIIRRQYGATSPLYLQLQGFLNEGI